MIRFLTDRAAYIREYRMLVVSDLHLGIEYDIQRSGITIPSQTGVLKERLNKLIRQTRAKALVILGDIKNEITGTTWQEKRELPEFFGDLSKKVKLHLVKGNHDGDIERVLSKYAIVYDPVGFRYKDVSFSHGHAWPSKDQLRAKYFLMGHVHPAVEFSSSGCRMKESCWARFPINKKGLERKYKTKTELSEGVLFPTFNTLAGSIAINSKNFRPDGPMFKNKIIKWKKSEIYLLDGTFLGKLEDL
ncbi:MAG TPA: metallophosphoesterase [archaeon]|nr:metallophosphoesterase [archaeon]